MQKGELKSYLKPCKEVVKMRVTKIEESTESSLIDDPSSSGGLDPYISIRLGTNFRSQIALVDSSAQQNSMAEHIFLSLDGVRLFPSNATLAGITGKPVPVLGSAEVPVSINGMTEEHKFLIFPSHSAIKDLILGMRWLRKTKAALDWAND